MHLARFTPELIHIGAGDEIRRDHQEGSDLVVEVGGPLVLLLLILARVCPVPDAIVVGEHHGLTEEAGQLPLSALVLRQNERDLLWLLHSRRVENRERILPRRQTGE